MRTGIATNSGLLKTHLFARSSNDMNFVFFQNCSIDTQYTSDPVFPWFRDVLMLKSTSVKNTTSKVFRLYFQEVRPSLKAIKLNLGK